MLITAGPTQEPIDAVRHIANLSSGRMGIALAEVAAQRGNRVTLLLGPTASAPSLAHPRTVACSWRSSAPHELPRCRLERVTEPGFYQAIGRRAGGSRSHSPITTFFVGGAAGEG